MLDNLTLYHHKNKPLYQQIVDGIALEIRQGTLLSGTKLPSIRGFSKSFGVSKTTVEIAYQILTAEGYINSHYKSGFQVAKGLSPDNNTGQPLSPAVTPVPLFNSTLRQRLSPIPYDFASYYIDEKYFDKTNWKRHINYVLKDRHTLNRYGDAQGELELRQAISSYLQEYRGVRAKASDLIIGAGFQSLLHLLIPLLQDEPRRILFPESGFPNAEAVFKHYHLPVEHYQNLKDYLLLSLQDSYPSALLYLRPNEVGLATTRDRLVFLEAIGKSKTLLIEDDYNGEFRWGKRPVPALRSLDPWDNIIYFGSFSGILLPSIRISYLLLPENLRPSLEGILRDYNQTASTLEQLALARFMSNGYLAKQVRRMRKGYGKKREILENALEDSFPGTHEIMESNSTVELLVDFKYPGTLEQALKMGVAIKDTSSPSAFVLIFAGLFEEEIPKGIAALAAAWRN